MEPSFICLVVLILIKLNSEKKMFTVKHIDVDGIEYIEEYDFVTYYPKNHKVDGTLIKEELVMGFTEVIGENRMFTGGKVYVMNDKGSTVASYYLDN